MSTMLRLVPADHGRPMTLDEFLEADHEEGWHYELIEGNLYVSPMANPPQDWIESYVHEQLMKYSERRPDVINHVTRKCRIFVPHPQGVTAPEPDIGAYRDYPDAPPKSWREVSPVLVVEVFDSNAEKDLERNVELYEQVESIEEYWAFDLRSDPVNPVMHVFRRENNAWVESQFSTDDVYETDLLPGLRLPVSKPAAEGR